MDQSDPLKLWPSVVATAIPMGLIAIRATPLGSDFLYVFLGLPGILLFWILAAVAALAVSIRSAADGRWRVLLSSAVLPAVVVAVVAQPTGSVRAINLAGDLIHFQLVRARYMADVARMPAATEPRLVIFDWGGWAGIANGVVYDESDEVALPADRQTRAWKIRAHSTELGCAAYAVHAVGQHFYLADFIC